MRILLTVPSLAREFGGPVEKAFGLRDAMRDQAVQVRLVGAGIGDGEGLPVLTTVHGTPVPRSFRMLRSAIDRADVVHILGYRDPVGTVAASAAIRANVPYLLEPCGMHRQRLRSILAKRAFDAALGRRIVDRAALLVATSEHERRELVQDGIPDRRIRTRMNGIMLPAGELPARGGIRMRVGVPMDAPMVLFIGRISRTKGLMELVRAVSPLRSVHVLIAGPDDHDGTLTELDRAASTLGERLHVETRWTVGHGQDRGLRGRRLFCPAILDGELRERGRRGGSRRPSRRRLRRVRCGRGSRSLRSPSGGFRGARRAHRGHRRLANAPAPERGRWKWPGGCGRGSTGRGSPEISS